MIIDFLTLAFGVTGLDAINKLDSQLSGVRNSTLAITGAFVGAAIGIERFLNTSISKSAVYKDFNLQTGLAIENLQQLEYLGQNLNLNLTTDKIRGSIMALQQNIANIKMGRGDASPFIMAGIGNIDNAFSVIEQLKTSLKGLDNQTATNLITKMGLTPEFLSIIRVSREEIDAIGSSKFLDIQQIQDIEKLGRGINILKLNLINLKDQAVARLTPDFSILVNDVLKWLRDNNEKIIKGIEGFVNVFTSLTKAIGNSLKFITEFIDKITGTDNGIKYLTSSIALLVLSFSPILRIFSLVALLLDDIYVWTKGGDSLFGGLYDGLKPIAELLMFTGKSIYDYLIEPITNAIKIIQDLINSIPKPILNIIQGAGLGALTGGKFGGLQGALIGGAVGGVATAGGEILQNFKNKDNFEDPSIYKTASNNSISNNNSSQKTINNITNNITTNDAKGFAEELQKQIKIAQVQY